MGKTINPVLSMRTTIIIHVFSYDNPRIIAGQGTIGLEILEQVSDIDAVIVPTGGGGLLAGVAVAIKTLKPNIKVIVSMHHVRFEVNTFRNPLF